MITTIVAGHVVERPAHEPTVAELHDTTAALAAQGIRVAPVVDIYHVLHLWALEPVDTRAEVRAIAAYAAVGDCRLAWHGAGA